MAENRDDITSLDLGIEYTGVAGNLQAADAFLEGDDSAIVTKPEDVEEVKDDPKKPEPKKVDAKPKVETKGKVEEEVDALDEIKDDEEEEEVDDKKVVKQAAKPEKEEEEVKSQDFNEYEALAKDLFKIGVFTPTEGEEDVDKIKLDTPELLKTRFEKEGQIKATQWLDSFLTRHGDSRRDLFEAIFVDGVDPSEYLPVHNEIQGFETVDITQEPVQEKIYREYYKRIGWSEDTIEKKLQKTKDYGDLADEVAELHPQLLAQDKERAQEMRDEKAENIAIQQRIDQEYKKSIASILEEKAKNRDFDGIPLNDKKKSQAFDFLYTKKYKSADGQLLTEFDKFIIDTRRPENHSLRVKIALLALEGFDLTKIEKRAVSKESSVIFNELAQKKTKKTGNSSQAAKVTSWFSS